MITVSEQTPSWNANCQKPVYLVLICSLTFNLGACCCKFSSFLQGIREDLTGIFSQEKAFISYSSGWGPDGVSEGGVGVCPIYAVQSWPCPGRAGVLPRTSL